MNLENIPIVELTTHYAKLRESLDQQEEAFKAWKKEMEAQVVEVSAEILKRMNDSNQTKLETHLGTFSKMTKTWVSITKAEDFANWIKEDPERICFAVLKARKEAVKDYIEEYEEPPAGVKYERSLDIIFRRNS